MASDSDLDIKLGWPDSTNSSYVCVYGLAIGSASEWQIALETSAVVQLMHAASSWSVQKTSQEEVLKSRIVALADQYGKFNMCQIKPHYKKKFGEELDEDDFGFMSTTDLVKGCSDVVQLDIQGSIIHISPQRNARPEAAPKSGDTSTLKPANSKLDQVKSRIGQLANDHGKFQAGQLKMLYKKKFGENLKEKEFGFKTAKALLESCSDFVSISADGHDLFIAPRHSGTQAGLSPQQNSRQGLDSPAQSAATAVVSGSSKLDQVKSRIGQLANDHGKFQAGQLKLLYKKKFGENLKEKEFGFKTAKALLESCSDYVSIHEIGHALFVRPVVTAHKSAKSGRMEAVRSQL